MHIIGHGKMTNKDKEKLKEQDELFFTVLGVIAIFVIILLLFVK